MNKDKTRILTILATATEAEVAHAVVVRQTGRMEVYERDLAIKSLVRNGLVFSRKEKSTNGRTHNIYKLSLLGKNEVKRAHSCGEIKTKKEFHQINGI